MRLRCPTAAAGRTRRVQGGFSLVEITVALAVLGLGVVSSLPFLQGLKQQTDLRSTAAGIADVMMQARMRSVVDRGTYTVKVDYATEDCVSIPPVVPAKRMGSVDIYFDDTDPDCPSLSAHDIVFRPNGTADAAGFEAVYLKSRSAKVAVRYRVKILGATGKVSVEKWAGGEWSGTY